MARTNHLPHRAANILALAVVVSSAVFLQDVNQAGRVALGAGQPPAAQPTTSSPVRGPDTEKDYPLTYLLDPDLPTQIFHAEQRQRTTRQPAETARIKAALRRHLRANPDPAMAWILAQLIMNQLVAGQPEWESPAESGGTPWLKQDATENYDTLADVLTLGFEHAGKGSDLWRRHGTALAKLRLLQGDWSRMNAMRLQLGAKAAIPRERLTELTAPPLDLVADWPICDPAMRSGNCGVVFKFEKDGKGLPGAHVALRKWPGRLTTVYSGMRADQMLLFFPYPVPTPYHGERECFHCMHNAAGTRYGISDANGEVRFEKLPEVPIQLEVLIASNSFTEPFRGWEMWIETEPGKPGPITNGMGRSAYDEWDPKDPALVVLKSGRTVHYPRFIVYPQVDLDVTDGEEVDPRAFVLTWQQVRPGQDISYELEMGVYDKSKDSWFEKLGDFNLCPQRMAVTGITKETLKATRWDVGARGVGGQRLDQGTLYALAVTARDKAGRIVAQPSIRRVCPKTPAKTQAPGTQPPPPT